MSWDKTQEARISQLMQERKIERPEAVRIMRSEQAKPKGAGGKSTKIASASKVLGKVAKAMRETTTLKSKAISGKRGKPTVSKGDKTHYDQQRVIDMFMSGKSIRECAEAQKPMSQVYAHRILTTKVPADYAAEQARRVASKEEAKAKAAKKAGA